MFGKTLRNTTFASIAVIALMYLLHYLGAEGNIEDFKTILAVISFVYGFFMASIFSFLRSKFFSFKTGFAEINGHIVSIYQLALLIKQKSYINKMRKALYDFVDSLETLTPEKFGKSQELFYVVFQQTEHVKLETKQQSNCHSRTLNALRDLSKAREVNEVDGEKYLKGGLKFIFILITAIFLFSAAYFTLLTGAYYYICPLLFAVVFLTFLLFDIDDLSYGEYATRYANIKQLKEMLDK